MFFCSADVQRFRLRNGLRRFTRGGLDFSSLRNALSFSIRSRNEALTVAMRVKNPDRSHPTINR
jgi:hypothetical protein